MAEEFRFDENYSKPEPMPEHMATDEIASIRSRATDQIQVLTEEISRLEDLIESNRKARGLWTRIAEAGNAELDKTPNIGVAR